MYWAFPFSEYSLVKEKVSILFLIKVKAHLRSINACDFQGAFVVSALHSAGNPFMKKPQYSWPPCPK